MRQTNILTLTVNPALDVAVLAPSVRPTHKIRTSGAQYDPGGGGINVARVVHELGGEALALFASGGATGRFIEELLRATAVPCQAVQMSGVTRISFNAHDQSSGLDYRFVPKGPPISPSDRESLLAALSQVEATWLVASGSLLPGADSEFYARLARHAGERRQRFVLDTSGPALSSALGQGIEVLKVSLGEFEQIVGREVRDLASQRAQALALVRSGAARKIILTLGAEGALLATGDETLHLPAIAVAEKSLAGAGDSFLAGLVLGLERGCSDLAAMQLASAAAAAAVASPGTARVGQMAVRALLPAGWVEANQGVLRPPLRS